MGLKNALRRWLEIDAPKITVDMGPQDPVPLVDEPPPPIDAAIVAIAGVLSGDTARPTPRRHIPRTVDSPARVVDPSDPAALLGSLR
jgi:hypothetical protein